MRMLRVSETAVLIARHIAVVYHQCGSVYVAMSNGVVYEVTHPQWGSDVTAIYNSICNALGEEE